MTAAEISPSQKGQTFAWWRLPIKNGVSNASDAELEGAIGDLDDLEIFCAGVVVTGVLLEFLLVFLHLPYESRLERFGSLLADAYVALGIVGEVLAGVRIKLFQGELTRRSNDRLADVEVRNAYLQESADRASERAAEADARAAEASMLAAQAQERASESTERAEELRLRAAKAELRIGRLSNPRHPDRGKFLSEISGKQKPSKVDIWYTTDGSDCSVVAAWLFAYLNDAGWSVEPPRGGSIPPFGSPYARIGPMAGAQPWGVTVLDPELKKDSGPGHFLFVALCASLEGEHVGAMKANGLPDGWLRIVVAPRP